MNVIELLSSPWAIVPEQLLQLQAIYAAHVRGESIDIQAIEARLGRPLANEQKKYDVRDGVGVLEIAGVIAPKANLFTQISGGAAASLLEKQVNSMAADPMVRAAVIDVDSPGGNVLGIPALADAVRALADAKPTVAVSTGTVASAAYWVGSSANGLYLSGTTDMVGSIGVIATHSFDPRKSGAVVTTEITAGKYKRIASDNAPLTAEGRAYLQDQVDALYAVFVDAVARNRRASVEQVLRHMADGRVFIGQQAIDAGLADGFGTVDQMVQQLVDNPGRFATRARATFVVAKPRAPHATTEGVAMTPQEQAAAFAAEHADAAALLRSEGATQERARIQAVRAQALPGHEALIERLAFDGTTTSEAAAAAVVVAERAHLAAQAAARSADAPPPVAQAAIEADPAAEATAPAGHTVHPTAGLPVNAKRADLHARAVAHQAAHPGTDYLAAVKAVQPAV